MSTERILQKLRVFSHSDGVPRHEPRLQFETHPRACSAADSHVRAYLNSADSAASLAQKTDNLIRACTHLFTPGRHGLKVDAQPYDGKLPALAGWPRNNVAP
jgi:hypothetical protein